MLLIFLALKESSTSNLTELANGMKLKGRRHVTENKDMRHDIEIDNKRDEENKSHKEKNDKKYVEKADEEYDKKSNQSYEEKTTRKTTKDKRRETIRCETREESTKIRDSMRESTTDEVRQI